MAADGTIKISAELDSKDAEKGLSGLGDLAKGGAKVAAAAIATVATALGALGVQALKATGELEQNMGGADQVFKQFAKTVKEVGATAFKDMGLSMSDFLATANKMGALLQGMGFSIEESMTLSTEVMQRASDVASIMGIDVSAAMDAVTGAAKGNFTMMDNLGVAMNATTLEAYALSKGIDTSYSSMTNQEKIGLAMEMFLEKTAYAAGNYAKENETLAGSINTAKAAMDNFLSGAGTAEEAADAFAHAMDVIIKNVEELGPRLIEGVITITEKLIPKLPGIIDKMLPVITSGAIRLIKAFADTLLKESKTLAEAARKIVNQVAKEIGDAIPALKPFTAVLELLTKDTETFLAVLAGVGTAFVAFKAITEVSTLVGTLSASFATAALQVSLLAASQGTAAVATMTLNGTLTAQEVLVALITGKITLATAAQWLWNAAMSANPIGLVAVAIGLLVAGIVLLTQHISEQQKEFEDYKSTVDDFVKSVDDSVNAVESRAEAFKDSGKAMQDEQKIVENLVDEIYTLAAASNKTAEDKAKLKLRIEELNKIAPELGLAYDEVTDSLNMTRQSLDAFIKAQYKQQELQRIQERMVEITRERAKMEGELQKAADKTAEAQGRVAEALDVLNSKEGYYGAGLQRSAQLGHERTQALEAEQVELEKVAAAEQELIDAYNSMGAEYEALTNQHVEMTTVRADASEQGIQREMTAEEARLAKLKEIESEQKAISDARVQSEQEYTALLTEEANKWGMTLDEYKDVIASLEEAEQARVDEVRGVYEEITGVVMDAFQKISDSQKGALGFDEMTKNLEHNAEVVRTWADNLDKLSKAGLDEGLIKQMRESPEKYAGQAAKLAQELGLSVDKITGELDPLAPKAKEKLDALNKTFEDNAKLAKEALEKSFNSEEMESAVTSFVDGLAADVDTKFKNAKFDESGKYVPQGIVEGIEADKSKVNDSIEGMSEEAYRAWQQANGIHSPSTLYEKSAEEIPAGIVKGVEGKKQTVLDAMKKVVDDASQATKDAVQNANFADIGRAICDGISQGIQNNAGKVADAASQMAQKAYEAAKKVLEIASPSKKGKSLGENFGLSIGLGMQNVEDEMSDMASSFVDSLHKAARSRTEDIAQNIAETTTPARRSQDTEGTTGANVVVNNNNKWYVNKEVDVERISRLQQERTERQLRSRGVLLPT